MLASAAEIKPDSSVRAELLVQSLEAEAALTELAPPEADPSLLAPDAGAPLPCYSLVMVISLISVDLLLITIVVVLLLSRHGVLVIISILLLNRDSGFILHKKRGSTLK